jgi:hypothetical protein
MWKSFSSFKRGGERISVASENKYDALTHHGELGMSEVVEHAGSGISVNQADIMLDAKALAIAVPIISWRVGGKRKVQKRESKLFKAQEKEKFR